MPATLHVIPFSHFNEKGMWILDYKGVAYEPKIIPNPANRAEIAALTGGTTSLPVFHDGDTVIGDTTDLALAMDERHPEPRLIPATEPERSAVLLWEDWADNSLGVHTRRFLFHTLRTEQPDDAIALFMSLGMSRFKASMGWRVMGPRICRGMGANAVTSQVSAREITLAMDMLAARLQDHAYLVGDTFTLADLTVCALLSPATVAGPWFTDPRYERVVAWRTELLERHGRRTRPIDLIPDQTERTRRREALFATAGA